MRREPRVVDQGSSLVGTAFGRLLAAIQALAFWATVVFPVGYVCGYLATVVHPGLSLPAAPVIGALLGANVLALVVGQRHDPGADRPVSGAGSRSTGNPHRAD
jgi:hypothetical protein